VPRVPGVTPSSLDPSDVQVAFGRTSTTLSADQAWVELPVVLIDKAEKAEVRDEPGLLIPYRVQVTYQPRVSSDCWEGTEETAEETAARKERCAVEPFLIVEQPFGLLRGETGQSLRFDVREGPFRLLAHGNYTVKVRLIAGNGDTSQTAITYESLATSGHYAGMIVLDSPVSMGQIPLSLDLFVTDGSENVVEWSQLLRGEYSQYGDVSLLPGLPLEEQATGQLVYGAIVASESMLFTDGLDDVPFVGLYQPSSGRLRFMFELLVPAVDPLAEPGADRLTAQNTFQHEVRRLVYMIGSLDQRTRRLTGAYRETLTGVAGNTYTIGGALAAIQSSSHDGPVPVPTELAVGYGRREEVVSASALEDYCSEIEFGVDGPALSLLQDLLGDEEQLLSHLIASYHGEEDLFGSLVSLEQRLSQAIDSLGESNFSTQEFFDHLRDEAPICTSGASRESCVDVNQITCAVHFYAEALLSGVLPSLEAIVLESDPWTVVGGGGSSMRHDGRLLRQVRRHLVQRFLFMLSELLMVYNRAAGDQIAEAYMLFLRTEVSNALTQELDYTMAAHSYHEQARQVLFHPRVQAALGRLSNMSVPLDVNGDDLINGIDNDFDLETGSELGPEGLHRLVELPVSQVKNTLAVLAKYFGLAQRSVGRVEGYQKALLRQTVQQTYLEGIALIALQDRLWGSDFALADQSFLEDALNTANDIDRQLRQGTNPLGFNAGEVFFESDGTEIDCVHSPGEDNFAYFVTQFRCHLERARQKRAEAITALTSESRSRDEFQRSIVENLQHFENRIDQLCGNTTDTADADYENECPEIEGSTNLEYQCFSDDCEMVVKNYEGVLDTSCRPEAAADDYKIQVGGDFRFCHRGKVGSLLRRLDELEVEQHGVRTRLKTTMLLVDSHREHITQMVARNGEIVADYEEKTDALLENIKEMDEIECAHRIAMDVVAAIPTSNMDWTSGARSAALIVADEIFYGAKTGKAQEGKKLERNDRLELMKHSQDQTVADAETRLHSLLAEGYNLAAQLNVVERRQLGVQYEIHQTLFEAQQAARHLGERNASIVDYLVGDQLNHRLQRNRTVLVAEAAYEQALIAAYKLGKAFEYEYNYPEVGEIANRVFRYRTIEQLDDYLTFLSEEQNREWKGTDAPPSGSAQLRLSLAELLVPPGGEGVSPTSGELETRDERFHDLVFSGRLRKIRPATDSQGTVEQIEIPLNLWLHTISDNSGSGYRQSLVSPEACNALIESVQIVFIGDGIHEDMEIGVRRDGLDDLRTCYMVPDPQRPTERPTTIINRFQVPAQSYWNVTPCVNWRSERCAQPLFRDRSLGASDWKIVIPNNDNPGNQALFEYDGRREVGAPVLRDIEVVIRYRHRSVVPRIWGS
jgi:hypothetical protein